MLFDITLQNDDGSVAFEGTANKAEATYLMNVGVNYLLQRGSMPILTGKEEETILAPSTETMQ